jgi:L-aminopeptidase/D-esterase-like protein
LTDGVPGLRIGHAGDPDARTGCTVLLGPFRGAADLRGMATGTREIDALSPLHLVPRIDAILLTGGSAFGLAAAEGVVRWLEERGVGFETGVARVPIVPAAVIFDLGVGRADRRPDAAMGRAACEAAMPGIPAQGRVGVGTGATVGKLAGREFSMDGGFGCAVVEYDGHVLMGLVVVNALGDVIGRDGRVVAGARAADGRFLEGARLVREGAVTEPVPAEAPTPGANTTLAVIVTDAPVARDALHAVARMAATGMARRISPVNTPFDGDIVFALSTAEESAPLGPRELLGYGVAAAHVLEEAILAAVSAA